MTLRAAPIRLLPALLLLIPGALDAQSLRGSPASLDVQNDMARVHEFTFLTTARQVAKFVDSGYLLPVQPSPDVQLHEVSYPYARREVVLFVDRLGAQYHAACGEPLVVTSLTRPESEQPPNASDRSVHPTGMAADLRVPRGASCRKWLEGVLLDLEGKGVIEATREKRPSHFHVAVFPQPYLRYVDALPRSETPATVVAEAAEPKAPARTAAVSSKASVKTVAAADTTRYRVRAGDSLWTIARRHATTVERIRRMNNLRSSRIRAGQVLQVPVAL